MPRISIPDNVRIRPRSRTRGSTRQQQILDVVHGRLDHTVKEIHKRLADEVPLGHSTPSDEEFLAIFELNVQKSPPTEITLPDGQKVIASPWVIALHFAEGGKAWIDRYLRVAKAAGRFE